MLPVALGLRHDGRWCGKVHVFYLYSDEGSSVRDHVAYVFARHRCMAFFFFSLNCKLQDSGIWQFYEWNRCVRSKSFTSIWQHTWISYSRWIGHDVRSAHFIQWHGIHKAVCLDVIWQAGNRVYIIFLFPWKKEDVLLSTSRHMTVFGWSE